MNSSTRLFIIVVLVADLMAIVYFGGRYIMTGSILSHQEHAHIVVPGADKPQVAKTNAAPEPVFDLATYVPDVKKGKKVAAKCMACHGFDKGGRNKTGPNLWGIYGAKVARNPTFNYSSVVAGKGGVWSPEELEAFLEAPKKYLPGTKMQFNGVKKPDQRADVIAWLKTLK